MKKTRREFKRIWDLKLANLIKATFEKFEGELSEHSTAMSWAVKHVILPASIFYVAAGLLIGKTVLDSLFLGFLVFVYSSFVPDLDSLLVVSKDKNKKPDSLAKFALLFFGPVFVYYAISSEAKPIYVNKAKEFHSTKYLFAYGLFLLVVGLIFYANPVERLALPLFGLLGYMTHLSVDGFLKLPQRNRQLGVRLNEARNSGAGLE